MERAIHTFEGSVNKDLIPTQVKNNDLIGALNNFSGKGGEVGARNPIPGNIEIPFTLPSGINTVIGSVEDKIGHSVIYFVRNSSGDNRILRYYPMEETIRVVLGGFQSGGSFLELGNKIHSAQVVDGKFLVWCDGYAARIFEQDANFTGNEPKKINMVRANLYNKNLSYEIHYDSLSFQTLDQTYGIEITDLDGGVIVANTTFYTVNPVIDADTAFQAFGTALDGAGFDITVEICSNKIIVESIFSERRVNLIQSTSDLHKVSINHYPVGITTELIELMKPVPKSAPMPRQVADANVFENKIWGNTFQFRHRFIFDDGEVSAFSPISIAPTNFVKFDYTPDSDPWTNFHRNDQSYNKIIIDLNEDLLDVSRTKTFIRKVELAVRIEDDGIWKSAGTYDVADLGVNIHEIEFFNDSVYSVIPSDTNSSSDAQALKNFDFIPRQVEAMELIAGKEGETRLALGGMIEGYDLEPCLDATIALNYHDGSADATAVEQTSKCKSFKRGGAYNICAIYEDIKGRQSPAVKAGRIKIPFDGDAINQNIGIDVEFTSPPPIWADRYRIGISKNQNQDKYVQLGISSVYYWDVRLGDDGSVTAIERVDGTLDNWTHMSFFVSNNVQNPTFSSFIQLFEYTENDNNVFLAQQGDRLQIVSWANVPGLSFIDAETLNYPIVGYSVVGPDGTVARDGYNIFIERDDTLADIDPDTFPDHWLHIEVYRQKNAEDQFYYEFSDTYSISNPGSPTRSHGGNKELTFTGDTYVSDMKLTVARSEGTGATPPSFSILYIPHIERPNMHFQNDQVGSDFGRPNAEDPYFREMYEYNKIRLSDVYIPSTTTNGLSSFRGIEFIKIDRSLGYIKKMSTITGTMLVICKNGCQPIYIGRDSIVDLAGNSLVGISDKILNIGTSLLVNFGTHHPESILNTGKYIYGFDVRLGVFWRYNTSNGMFPISDYGYHNHFKDKVKENWFGMERGTYDAYTGFDRRRGIVFLYTVTPLRVEEVLGFNEDKNGFEGEFFGGTDYPEYFGMVGVDMVSFKDGALWRHGRTQLAEVDNCNFYGVQQDCTVTFAFNKGGDVVKIPHHIRIRANNSWSAPRIEVLPNASFAEGQLSRLKPNKFNLFEGHYCADFLRDINDTRDDFLSIVDVPTREATALLQGRHIRGEAVLITLQLDDPANNSNLESANISYTNSFNSF